MWKALSSQKWKGKNHCYSKLHYRIEAYGNLPIDSAAWELFHPLFLNNELLVHRILNKETNEIKSRKQKTTTHQDLCGLTWKLTPTVKHSSKKCTIKDADYILTKKKKKDEDYTDHTSSQEPPLKPSFVLKSEIIWSINFMVLCLTVNKNRGLILRTGWLGRPGLPCKCLSPLIQQSVSSNGKNAPQWFWILHELHF